MATSRSKALPWVAVILAAGRESYHFKGDGRWVCYTAPTRDEAIGRALKARASFHNGPERYQILVARLEAKVVVPLNFELAPLSGGEIV